MYLSMARRVSGSSQDRGKRTIRVGISHASIPAERALGLRPTGRATDGRQRVRVVVHLQGPDARRQIEDAVQATLAYPLHQGVHPQSKLQIEHRLPVLDEKVPVACAAIHHPGAVTSGGSVSRIGPKRRRAGGHARHRPPSGRRRVAQLVDGRLVCEVQRPRLVRGEPLESNPIVRPQLSQFPEFCGYEGGGTHEAAQRRAVGPEDDRHVAGEIHGADRVGVVVDVGRMQAGFAAVGTSPLGLWPQKAHAGAARVVVHGPARCKEDPDILLSEEVGRPVGSIEHAQLPVAPYPRNDLSGDGGRLVQGQHATAQVQQVARHESPSPVPAELSKGERGPASHVARNIDAATDGEVGSASRAVCGPDRERGTCRYINRFPIVDGAAVERRGHRRAGQANHRGRIEAQGRPGDRDLESGRLRRIADGAIGEAKRQAVHGPRRRHADIPIAEASRVVLHGCLGARGQHLDAPGSKGEPIEGARGHAARRKRRSRDELPQIIKIRLNPCDFARIERAPKRRHRGVPIRAAHNHLREQRIVVRSHHSPVLDPRINPNVARETGVGEQPRRRPEPVRRILGVYANFNR